jgi:hypothetical protein
MLGSRLFLEAWNQSVDFVPKAVAPSSLLGVMTPFVLYGPGESTYQLEPAYHRPADLSFSVPSSTSTYAGAGILTCFPSPTPVGLGLGPTNPGRMNLAQETLGFSANEFLTRFIATHVSISSLPAAPPSLSVTFNAAGMLPYHSLRKSAASVTCLSPVTFSAQVHSTSELLRFL